MTGASDSAQPKSRSIRFPLGDLPEQLAAFAQRWPMARADRLGLAFAASDDMARLRVPLLAPRVNPGEAIDDYRVRVPGPRERCIVLLLQAGAAAIGYWEGDELLAHKADRKYVVRGHGKAQSLHKKTVGKSRYGSRLRLQNWRHLLAATAQRLSNWGESFGEPERVFCAVPVRVWSEFLAGEVPPFLADQRLRQRVPMHVHRPDFAELLRVHAWLGQGRLELPGD